MNMEEFRGLNENFDSFPVGLRVLAVDDDAVCLKLLETQLRKCQYRVTTSSQARKALKMLRENKDGFDLVISDVHMPDMDGFKLLELVGLEMDVPVIMLSANDDPKLVLKGVTHGACDYLVKPVKHELLKNIWQHVIRRKKIQSKSADEAKNPHVNGEVCGSPKTTDSSGYRNRKKLRRKRKDNEEDTESDDEDDPARPSKVRVVWTADLHQKFITAVQQLGFEKAVPKKILDLMNTQGITRENVASHLQKYRIYLKKVSEEANMRAAAGLDSYRTYSTDWLGDYRRRLANAALSSPYATTTANNVNLRVNSPAANNVNLLNLTPPSLKTCPSQNPFVFQGNQSCTDNSRIFSSANAFRLNSAASKMMLHANAQQTLGGVFNPQLAAHNYMTSSNPEPYNGDINGFSNSPVDGLTETNSSSTHYFPNYLPNFENGNEKPASEGFVPQSYDSMEDFMNAMLKREQDGALLNSDSGFDDCLLEKLYNEAFAVDPR